MTETSVFDAARQAAPVGMEISVVAARDPQRMALISAQGNRSFAELNARANQIARLLREAGVQAGDPVALVCGNRLEFAEVRFAAHRVGARLTPVNWHLAADEVAYVVEDCEAKVVFLDIRSAVVGPSIAKLPRLARKLAIGGAIAGFEDYETALKGFDAGDIDNPVLGNVMQYTSGTTGRPKGVLRKQSDPAKAADLQALLTAVFQFQPDAGTDCALVTGPLYHSGPFNLCLTTPLTAGVGAVMMDKWDPEETLRLIAKHRITHAFFVPTMFSRLLQLPAEVRARYDVSSLRFVIHGAAPCPISVKQQMLDWFGPVIWEMFAGTEGSGTIVSPQEWLAKPGTVGKPGLGQIRILDESGEAVGPGEEGQIWVVNPKESSFEYYKAPEKTRSVQRDGYFTAGDIGVLDADGYLFITGRSAEVIIAGGVNIYPQEIDDVLVKHPAVADVACVGVPDDDRGEGIKAVVQLKSGFTADATLVAELIRFCEPHLAKQKWPQSVDFVAEIPRSPAGKVYRRQLRDGYWADRERKI